VVTVWAPEPFKVTVPDRLTKFVTASDPAMVKLPPTVTDQLLEVTSNTASPMEKFPPAVKLSAKFQISEELVPVSAKL